MFLISSLAILDRANLINPYTKNVYCKLIRLINIKIDEECELLPGHQFKQKSASFSLIKSSHSHSSLHHNQQPYMDKRKRTNSYLFAMRNSRPLIMDKDTSFNSKRINSRLGEPTSLKYETNIHINNANFNSIFDSYSSLGATGTISARNTFNKRKHTLNEFNKYRKPFENTDIYQKRTDQMALPTNTSNLNKSKENLSAISRMKQVQTNDANLVKIETVSSSKPARSLSTSTRLNESLSSNEVLTLEISRVEPYVFETNESKSEESQACVETKKEEKESAVRDETVIELTQSTERKEIKQQNTAVITNEITNSENEAYTELIKDVIKRMQDKLIPTVSVKASEFKYINEKSSPNNVKDFLVSKSFSNKYLNKFIKL